jgi:hypothetical protein
MFQRTRSSAVELYHKYYTSRNFERLELFQLLAARYGVESALYPGGFVHITPSLVFPITAYVDTDRQAIRFFADPAFREFVAEHKTYECEAQIVFYAKDYRTRFGAEDASFDLLISQYAGLVSRHCKRYLRVGGLLLANNSHGDASMASIDDDYALVAAISQRKGHYRLVDDNLDTFFIPKAEIDVTPEYIEELGRGIGYTRSASAYLFRRVR